MKYSDVEIDYVKVGLRVSEKRKAKNFSGREFAEKIGISSNYLSAIECGKKHPTLEMWIAICNTLDISIDYLISGIPRLTDLS